MVICKQFCNMSALTLQEMDLVCMEEQIII